MKAALGKNVRISLPKAYQISQNQNKCLSVKGVPTDRTETDFKEFLDLNKISYAKAERLKSKKDGRVLPIFQLELSDPAKPRLYFLKILCVMLLDLCTKWKNFTSLFRFGSALTQCFRHLAQNCKSKQKCVICSENHSHKECPRKEAKQPKCANCSGPHVASYKGCPKYKNQAFRQHVINN